VPAFAGDRRLTATGDRNLGRRAMEVLMAKNTDDTSTPEKVAASFQRLTAAAADLNAVSDNLGKPISALDTVLKGLHLGLETWVVFSQTGFETGFEDSYIGYAKINSKWGVALKVVSGDHNSPEYASVNQWLFNDAPRLLRLEAIDKLPELIEGLIDTAHSTAQKLSAKIAHTQQIVETITKSTSGQRK
jgi:hypothetical protein